MDDTTLEQLRVQYDAIDNAYTSLEELMGEKFPDDKDFDSLMNRLVGARGDLEQWINDHSEPEDA